MNSVYTLSLPEYTLDSEPDFATIGRRIDALLATHFRGRRIALRGISLVDHPDHTLDDLIATILELGTDRYDPNRAGVHDDFYRDFAIDLFAVACLVSDRLDCPHYHGDRCSTGSVAGELLLDCYSGAKVDRGFALRIDILMVYDLDQLAPVPIRWTPGGPVPGGPPPPEESCEFIFRDPGRKRDALLGIVRLLR